MSRTSYTVYQKKGRFPDLIYVGGAMAQSRKEAIEKATQESSYRIFAKNCVAFTRAEMVKAGIRRR